MSVSSVSCALRTVSPVGLGENRQAGGGGDGGGAGGFGGLGGSGFCRISIF